MLKRFIPTLFIFLLFIGCSAHAQVTDNIMSIDMSKSVQLPADLIIFNINLNAEGSTPKEAFSLHKKREQLLASLLKDLQIDAKDIKFQPVQISKRYRNDNKNLYSQTTQQVSVTFSDFGIYEQIQLTLIENGFDSFNGNFSSTRLDEGKDKALELAIEAAKSKAQFIAQKAGIKLGAIKNINYSEFQVSQGYRMMEAKISSDSELMDFPQTVTVSGSIHISFNIKN